MVAFKALALVLLAAAATTTASPCPFGQLFEEGKLTQEEAAKFLAARHEGNAAVERMIEHEEAKRAAELEIEYERQDEIYKRSTLPFGGGLKKGKLQPFTGSLSAVAVPAPQPTGLAIVPDDAHPFVWPKKSDVRGMCPTLNTMANHGYISRNGITTFAEAANACQITLGFGYDTCTFLSALGLLSGGDLLSGIYSIGGADKRVPNTLGPSLGISTHGPFEVDQSISRNDTYFGDNVDFLLTRWNRIVDITENYGGFFNIEMWNAERQITYQESRSTNPVFDAGVKHFAVTLAERVFIFRALPNGTFPGLADFRNVAPFYLNETFPPFWFRRGTAYSLANVADDVLALYLLGPTELGQNEGLNNFVPLGLDIGALTTTNEIKCLLFESMVDFLPGQVSSTVLNNLDLYEGFILGAISPFFSGLPSILTGGTCGANLTSPGKNAGTKVKGKSAKSPILVNGTYLAHKPSFSQIP